MASEESTEFPGLAIDQPLQAQYTEGGVNNMDIGESVPGTAGEPMPPPNRDARFSSNEPTPEPTPPSQREGSFSNRAQLDIHQQALARAHAINQMQQLPQLTESLSYSSMQHYEPSQYNPPLMQFDNFQFQPAQTTSSTQRLPLAVPMVQDMDEQYGISTSIGTQNFTHDTFGVSAPLYSEDHSSQWTQQAGFDTARSNPRSTSWRPAAPTLKLNIPNIPQSTPAQQSYARRSENIPGSLSVSSPKSLAKTLNRKTGRKRAHSVIENDSDEDADGDSDEDYRPESLKRTTSTRKSNNRAFLSAAAKAKEADGDYEESERDELFDPIDEDAEPEQEGLYDPDYPGSNTFLPRDQIEPVGQRVYAECLRLLGLGKKAVLENDEKNKLRPSDFDIFFYKKNNSRGKMTWPQVKMFVEWQYRGEPDSDDLLKVPRTFQNRFNEVKKFFTLNGERIKHLKENRQFHAYGHKKANQSNKRKATTSTRSAPSNIQTVPPINIHLGSNKRKASEDLILPPATARRPRTRAYQPPESDIEERLDEDNNLSTQPGKSITANATIYWDIYEVNSLSHTIQDDSELGYTHSIIDRSTRLRDGVFANGHEAVRAAEVFATPHMWRSCSGNPSAIDAMKRNFRNEMGLAVEEGVLGSFEISVWRRSGEKSCFECLEECEDVIIRLVPRKIF